MKNFFFLAPVFFSEIVLAQSETEVFLMDIDITITRVMIVIPNVQFAYVKANTGPYVFDVVQETWSSMAQGIGFFNAMELDYIQATNDVRFGTWGSGVIDFSIDPILGVQENTLANGISIYPNPANDFVNIKLNTLESSNVVVDIFGINGQKLSSVTHTFLNSLPLKLNTKMLSSGMYLVRFTNEQQHVRTGKLLVR